MPRVEQSYFTEEEKAALRKQIRQANADAQAELRKRGVTMDERVRLLKAAGKWPE